jgi:hypothetical protein
MRKRTGQKLSPVFLQLSNSSRALNQAAGLTGDHFAPRVGAWLEEAERGDRTLIDAIA